MAIDYMVLKDTNLPVNMGSGRTIDFDLPQNAVIDNNAQKAPIVSFMISSAAIFPDPSQMTKPNKWKVKLAVEVNDRRISAYNFYVKEGGTERVIQEVMNPNTRWSRRLNHGRNTLHFEIDGGMGVIYLQDIVVWYHTS